MIAVVAVLVGAMLGTGAVSAAQAAPGSVPVVITASAASASVPYGTSNQLSVSGLPSDATGMVAFERSGTTLCVAILPSTSCSTPPGLGSGPIAFEAIYAGDNVYAEARASASFTISKVAGPFSAGHASTVPFGTANTISVFSFPPTATGSVTIASGGSTLCTIADITTAGSCTTSTALPVGTYPFTIDYSGDRNYTSRSVSSSFRVVQAPVRTLAATVTDPRPVFGSGASLSTTGLPAGASGSIAFTSGALTLCSISDVTAASSCRTASDLAAGTYPVTATYSGDTSFATASATTSFEVVPAPVTLTAVADAAQVPFGTGATLRFAGLPAGATGSVVFASGATTLCRVADITMATRCTTPADLAAGAYAVTATYSGDRDHRGGSAATSFTVAAAPVAPSPASAALARTGVDPTASVLWASALLALGAAITWSAARVRRSR